MRENNATTARIAVYAGTFDPVTMGHLDIAERASRLFDKVIFAVARENYKNNLFSFPERIELVKKSCEHLPNVEVDGFDGLLVEYCRKRGARAIIRGLRAVSDFDHEMQMALLNKSLNDEIEQVFFMADHRYMFISSTIIKNTFSLGGDVSALIPAPVAEAMREKYK